MSVNTLTGPMPVLGSAESEDEQIRWGWATALVCVFVAVTGIMALGVWSLSGKPSSIWVSGSRLTFIEPAPTVAHHVRDLTLSRISIVRPEEGQIVIAFKGDSNVYLLFTEFCAMAKEYGWNVYPVFMPKITGGQENSSPNGGSTGRGKKYIHAWLDRTLWEAGGRIDYVVLSHGQHDAVDLPEKPPTPSGEFESNFRFILEVIEKKTGAKTILLTTTPFRTKGEGYKNPVIADKVEKRNQLMEEYDRIINRTGKELNIPVIDIAGMIPPAATYDRMGMHLEIDFYRRVAEEISIVATDKVVAAK